MDFPKFIVSNQEDESISVQRVKQYLHGEQRGLAE